MKVLVLGGPTATGKTELSLELAKRFGGEIVNADSAQLYRGMDIGTAKPPKSYFDEVPHHLFSVAECDDPWDVKRYEREALEVLKDIWNRGRLPILVGGSGFYIKGVLEGVPEDVPRDEKLRKVLWNIPCERLYRWLKRLDPERAKEIHPSDKKRIVRAIEMCFTTGRPASSFKWSGECRWDALRIALDRPREELKERIYRRVEKMMQAGWLDEVKELVEKYGWENRVLNSTLGYRELLSYLRGELSLDEAVSLIKKRTYKYSKRQRTWFKGEGFLFFDASDREGVFRRVKEWLDD